MQSDQDVTGEAKSEAKSAYFIVKRGGSPRFAARAARPKKKKKATANGAVQRPGRRPLTASDKTRVLGRRVVLWRPDEVDVARRDHWLVVHCTTLGRDGYQTVKLLNTKRAKKNVYYLNWRDGKLVNQRDAGVLFKYQPEIYAWVVEELNRTFADKKSA